jgi:hypothetical protein
MKLTQEKLTTLINEYIDDSYSFGDEEPDLINETLTSYKQLLTETNNQVITLEALNEHASTLNSQNKDVFDDFILYIKMTELDQKLFN